MQEVLSTVFDYPPEEEIQRLAGSTSRPWQKVVELFTFTQKEKGSRFLDVGGGGSDITAHLIELGYDAYAIDPRYKSKPDLKGHVKKHLANMSSRHKGDPTWTTYIREQEVALEGFLQSAKENPEHYKAATATNIPFPGEYFDMVFSLNAVTEYLDLNPDVLAKAVQECLRVTKKGGTVQLHPFKDALLSYGKLPNEIDAYIAATQIRIDNQEALLRRLNVNGTKYRISEAGISSHKILIITKA